MVTDLEGALLYGLLLWQLYVAHKISQSDGLG